jgi:ABC-type nitrate/sulfonate/bicarbonate transport system substrate-binding protein
MGITVLAQSPITKVSDLRGKKVAVTNPASLTYFLVRELSRQQGWGSDGVTPVPLGAPPAMFAALKAKQVDALISSAEGGYALEKTGDGHVLMTYGGLLPDYHSLIIFATDKMIESRPQVLKDFLAGWFETVSWMRADKAKSVQLANAVIKLPLDVADKTYDRVTPTYSSDGRFTQKAFQKLVDSTQELGIAEPGMTMDAAKLYTEQFLPPK